MTRLSISGAHGILLVRMKKLFGSGFIIAGIILFATAVIASAETVRSRASDHFDRILWTQNPESLQATALPGVSLPGGSESYAAMILKEDASIPGIYPRIEEIGMLNYDSVDTKLVDLLTQLASSLQKKTVAESLLRADRRFLGPVTGYRLRRVPLVEQVFFSTPEGGDPAVQKAKVSLHSRIDGRRTILVIMVEAVYHGGSWKISDIQFDSGSYAQFFVQN